MDIGLTLQVVYRQIFHHYILTSQQPVQPFGENLQPELTKRQKGNLTYC